jgi:alpha-galactosidase
VSVPKSAPTELATGTIRWGSPSLQLDFDWTPDSGPSLRRMSSANGFEAGFTSSMPLIEVLSVPHGHALSNDRLVGTKLGAAFRYDSHTHGEDARWITLDIVMVAPELDVEATIHLRVRPDVAAVRSEVTVRNRSTSRNLTLQSVTSWVSSFGGRSDWDTDDWELLSGRTDWLAEGRWEKHLLRGSDFPALAEHLTGIDPRGAKTAISTGTWSTGRNLPVGAISSAGHSLAWAWQVEHNGGWRWEVGENTADGYVALAGPTEIDHSWLKTLAPDESFTTVPVAIAIGTDATVAIAELTRYRRAARRPHPDNSTLKVVFNDYMNTLSGDPTTEKLLPLIDAAAEVGAEVFCIDAGWYAETGFWWDSVGQWLPSTSRFPGGLGKVIDYIRLRGMVPGLWLEPEVIGVRSPVASTLPDDAFFQRRGERVVEQDRYHLDLRHPAAIAHLDEVVDRLVGEFGIGFFKLDYNINPGAGTDVGGDGLGVALLEHNRAHLDWIDSVLDRHPELIIENCASGAMRMDFAMMSRLQLQSTSDQQDFAKYPPIAATAPLSVLPEQAANWAYPQPGMTAEEVSFCLATSLLGRFYLSGYLNQMTDEMRSLVTEAVEVNKSLRSAIVSSTPFWPLGIPEWSAPWVALGLRTPTSRYITMWSRSTEHVETQLRFPELIGKGVLVSTVFPASLAEWRFKWNADTGVLEVENTTSAISARTIELRVADGLSPS